jgi:microcin C transport system substrate-binding protein
MIPQFYNDTYRTARWDRFGRPETLPEYFYGFPDIWWYDEEKAQKVAAR